MKTVLIIEDGVELAASWQEAFELQGLYVIHEPKYETAIGILKNTPVDLVITDIALPNEKGELLDFAGLAIISFIALQIEYPPKIIAVSGSALDKTNQPFLPLLECSQLLQKPFGIDTIVTLGLKLLDERETEEQHRRMQEDLRILGAAIGASQDAFLVAKVDSSRDSEVETVFANKAYTELTGYTEEETLGRKPRSHEGSGTNKDSLVAIASALLNQRPLSTEILLYGKSKTPFWCDYQMSPIPDESGRFTHWLIVLRDITQQKNVKEQLASQSQMLRRSNSDLEQFAYVASHDLQEPLRAVGGFMQILARDYSDQLDEKGVGYIRKSVEGASRMQQLINDLLQFSRLTKDQPTKQVSLNDAIDGALTALESKIARRSAEVVVGPMPTIHGQVTQLSQLFQNLIDNAIKYCDSNSPRVNITSAETEDHWLITVADNGIGIAPEYREQIFSIFKRLHHREDYAGTGIGLAVCRRVVERHGGQIYIEGTKSSKNGQAVGSRFVIRFPKNEDAEVGDNTNRGTSVSHS